jgi:ABC-2 type transport system permease protein
MRGLLAGEAFPARLLLEGGTVAAVELLAVCYLFAQVFRRAVRSGLLARYSAEGTA